MKDPWQVTSTLNSRLNFRLVICDLQSLGHDPIVVSTKPAAGHLQDLDFRAGQMHRNPIHQRPGLNT